MQFCKEDSEKQVISIRDGLQQEPASAILVWDVPVRVFHWMMVLSFVVAYVTAESEYWRLAHITAGYTMGGLVCFRLIWGLVGTHYARFSNFVKGPAVVTRYLCSLFSGQPEHHVGHNPAGALSILGLLGLTLMTVTTGWFLYNSPEGSEWWEDIHEIIANVMLSLIGLHILGVVTGSRAHGENLTISMITGFKRGQSTDGISRPYLVLGILLLLVVLGFWGYQWQFAPQPQPLD
ncbi:Cytochrome B [Gammaproteobacteria bacterium]